MSVYFLVCIGTNGRMSVPSNREHHYRNLRDRFTNCTYVDGNLELTWLQDQAMDLSFVQHIREVTGYVLISHVDVQNVVLPRYASIRQFHWARICLHLGFLFPLLPYRLQIIRGRTLFKANIMDNQFGLFVTYSQMHTLQMPALRDILSGSVGLFNNYNLCHMKTINWDEIISGECLTGNSSAYKQYLHWMLTSSLPKCFQIPKNLWNSLTISPRRNVNARHAIRHARPAAGARVRTIVRNSAKSTVRRNAPKDVASDRNRGTAVTCSVPAVAQGPRKKIAWLVVISMMTACANRNARQCRNTIRPITCGNRIRMANTPMALPAFAIAPSICWKTMAPACAHARLTKLRRMANVCHAMDHVRKLVLSLASSILETSIRSVAAPSLRGR